MALLERQKLGRGQSILAVGLGCFFYVFLFALWRVSHVQEGDTDRFYHFAISRELALTGSWFLRSVPQFSALGWGDYFPDKEFLFHALTGLGYRFGADTGVEVVSLICAGSTACVLFLIAQRFLPLLPAFFATFALFFSHSFLFRMLFVRPFVLAIGCFLLLALALLDRRPKLAAIAGALYALTYHVFILPLALLGLFAALSFLAKKEERGAMFRASLMGLVGLVLGTLVNPYFPSNVLNGFHHSQIPLLMRGELRGLSFAMELFPPSAEAFLGFYWLPLLALAAGAFVCGLQWAQGKRPLELYLGMALTSIFVLLVSGTVRAAEYLFPAAGLLLMPLLAALPTAGQKLLVAALLAGVQAIVLFFFYESTLKFNGDAAQAQSTWDAIATLPRLEKGATVYNCQWERGAFLYYARPDLQFVNLLDPTMLYFHSRLLFEAQEAIRIGKTADIAGVLHGAFHADYMMCDSANLARQLSQDPNFQQLYPRAEDFRKPYAPATYLFQLRSPTPAAFVRAYRLFPVPAHNAEEARELRPQEIAGAGIRAESGSELKLSQESQGFRCTFIRPSPEEVRRLAGADYLALGGGSALRLWWNGKFLLSLNLADRPKLAQSLAKLPRSLRAGDDLSVLACGTPGGYWGLSLSAWKGAEIAQLCAWKRAEAGLDEAKNIPEQSVDNATCLGKLAGPTPPESWLPPRTF